MSESFAVHATALILAALMVVSAGYLYTATDVEITNQTHISGVDGTDEITLEGRYIRVKLNNPVDVDRVALLRGDGSMEDRLNDVTESPVDLDTSDRSIDVRPERGTYRIVVVYSNGTQGITEIKVE